MTQLVKKTLVGGALVLGGLVLGLVLFSGGKVERAKSLLGAAVDFNLIDAPTHTATSTGTRFPVKVLSRNYNRIYALVENDPTNSSNVYLFFGNFATSQAAADGLPANLVSSTSATGTVVLAPGGSYEILPENMVIGDMWATGTASGILIKTVDR